MLNFPKVLQIVINRIDMTLGKVQSLVRFGETLSLSHYKYQLFGIVFHDGVDLNQGHFTAICKRIDEWILFDDNNVEVGMEFDDIKNDEWNQQNVYMLLYVRKE